MGKQRKMFKAGGLDLQPAPGISEPRLWVRRLVIWQKPGEQPVRDIKLHRGLNIVWSPDPAEKGAKGDSIGHGAGKTLFCTLLRYCLGEDSFAPESQHKRIKDAFKEGYVGAEVVLDGTTWAILRPIGNRLKHFAVPNGSLEQLLDDNAAATTMQPFIDALQESLITPDVVGMIPDHRPGAAWQSALAAMTRDQGCHLEDVLSWRDAKSDSRSPVRDMSKDQRLVTLRLLVSAYSAKELELEVKIAEADVHKRDAEAELAYQKQFCVRLHRELCKSLSLDPAKLPLEDMGVAAIESAAKARLEAVRASPGNGSLGDPDAIQKARSEATRLAFDLTEKCNAAQSNVALANTLAQQAERELPTAKGNLDTEGNLRCPICDKLISTVLAEGCGITLEPCNVVELRRRIEVLNKQRDDAKAAQERHTRELESLQPQLQRARAEAERLDSQLAAILNTMAKARGAQREAERLVDDAARLKAGIRQRDEALRGVHACEAELNELREKAKHYREKHQEVFTRLSEHISALVRRLLGKHAEGKLVLDGKGLHVNVALGGDLSTAAIEVLKVWAADLAILCLSIEGRTKLPAFLIHDSPRESDLGQSIYERTFELAQELETIGKEPLFQYIVTTTSEPPKALQKPPHCILNIHGAPAEARLLRTDL